MVLLKIPFTSLRIRFENKQISDNIYDVLGSIVIFLAFLKKIVIIIIIFDKYKKKMSENRPIIEITASNGEKQIFNLNNSGLNLLAIPGRRQAKNFLKDVFSGKNNNSYDEEDITKLTIKFVKYNTIDYNNGDYVFEIINAVLLSDKLNYKNKVLILDNTALIYKQKEEVENIEKLSSEIFNLLKDNIVKDDITEEDANRIIDFSIATYIRQNNIRYLNELIAYAASNVETVKPNYVIKIFNDIINNLVAYEKFNELNEILNNTINNSNIDFIYKCNFLNNVIEQFVKNEFGNIKKVYYIILNSILSFDEKKSLIGIAIEKLMENNKYYYMNDILYSIINNKELGEFLKSDIIMPILNRNINQLLDVSEFIKNISHTILTSNTSEQLKIKIVNYLTRVCIENNRVENTLKIIDNIINNIDDFDYQNKITELDFLIKNVQLFTDKLENTNKYLSELEEKLMLLKDFKASINLNEQEKLIYSLKNDKQEEIKHFLLEQKNIIIKNKKQINIKIKPLENTEENIVSHITDTHGDSLAILGSLKQTGFIGELTGEMLFYDVDNKKFYNLSEINDLLLQNNLTLKELKEKFVIIPDFNLPNQMPDGIFVHTGDIQDRGQESAESLVILRRLMDLYKEKYIEQGLNEEEAKEKLINKIVITTSDHDDYNISEFNEKLSTRSLLYIEGTEEEFKNNFNKHHKIQEDMFIDGYINSGRLIQTKDENLKILVNHSYVDTNSAALVLASVIFPYNETFYGFINNSLMYKKIDKKYIQTLQEKFTEIMQSGKYQDEINIFNKIKANIIKSILKIDVNDINNIDESKLNEAFEKLPEKLEGKNLNDIFVELRKYIGIPVKGEEFKGIERLTATEVLRAFSIGTIAVDEMNRDKMKEADRIIKNSEELSENELEEAKKNRHYDDPIIFLITFRNGRTNRGDGFLDSTVSGVRGTPIEGLLNSGIVVLNGHDRIIEDEQVGNKKEDMEEKIGNIRSDGNYLNDRGVSYIYNADKIGTFFRKLNKEKNLTTYIAPQIFRKNEKGEIVCGVYDPLIIERGKYKFTTYVGTNPKGGEFNSAVYGEPNPESRIIEGIYLMPKEEIINKLGVGTEECEVKNPMKKNIINENFDNINYDLGAINNNNINLINNSNDNVFTEV